MTQQLQPPRIPCENHLAAPVLIQLLVTATGRGAAGGPSATGGIEGWQGVVMEFLAPGFHLGYGHLGSELADSLSLSLPYLLSLSPLPLPPIVFEN